MPRFGHGKLIFPVTVAKHAWTISAKSLYPWCAMQRGSLWMVDRHHRLRSLLGIDPEVTTWGYVIAEVDDQNPTAAMTYLQTQGWLYLYDSRGTGATSSQ